jgi:drug/metabolite transporter (DMT)-like permease
LELPRGRARTGVAIFGVLNFAGAFGFGYYALVHIEAGVGSTLLALTPLMTLVLAALHREEHLRRDALFGGALAVIGVALLSRASLSGSVPVLAVAAAFGSVVCFAEAAVLIRRFPPVAPIMTNAIAMGVGSVVLLAVSVAARETWTIPSTRATWIAFAYLVVVGSIAVFLLYLFVLRHWEASRAVYFDVLIPPAAVLLSAWLDDEPITAALVIGGTLVLAGAYVGAMRHAGDPAI